MPFSEILEELFATSMETPILPKNDAFLGWVAEASDIDLRNDQRIDISEPIKLDIRKNKPVNVLYRCLEMVED